MTPKVKKKLIELIERIDLNDEGEELESTPAELKKMHKTINRVFLHAISARQNKLYGVKDIRLKKVTVKVTTPTGSPIEEEYFVDDSLAVLRVVRDIRKTCDFNLGKRSVWEAAWAKVYNLIHDRLS